MRELTVNHNDANQRLDQFMQKTFRRMPHALMYKYIRQKCVRINGKRVTQPDLVLQCGDILTFYINETFFEQDAATEESLEQMKPNFRIVYEDDNLLLVDKPVGLLCQPDDSEQYNTLDRHIRAYLYRNGAYNPKEEHAFAPALCNRIDRNTQGIVIAAKNAEALRILNEKIKTKEVRKFYRCLVFGTPEKHAFVRAYLKKFEKDNRVVISDTPREGYKEILTSYDRIATNGTHSILRVELHTGRTHQIRAQMAHLGHPLLGDTKYGTAEQNKGLPFRFQALASCELLFDFKTPAGQLEYLQGKTFFAEPFFADYPLYRDILSRKSEKI